MVGCGELQEGPRVIRHSDQILGLECAGCVEAKVTEGVGM